MNSVERENLAKHFGEYVLEMPNILAECESMLRLYSLTAQELFFKWESYCLNRGTEDTKISLESARDLKRTLQEKFEHDINEKKLKAVNQPLQHRTPGSTPSLKFGKENLDLDSL